MKRASLFLLSLLLLAAPLHAADRTYDLTGWATWVDPNSSGTFNSSSPNQPFDVSFDGKLGYGAGLNLFFGNNLSASFDASAVETSAMFRNRAVSPSPAVNSNGKVKMIPLTAVLQLHFAPKASVDPYIGAGAAYILFDNASTVTDVGNLGVRKINFKDDAGLVLNAGLGFALGEHFGLVLDGKYVPVKSSATAVYATGPNTESRVKINPVMFSVGLSMRY